MPGTGDLEFEYDEEDALQKAKDLLRKQFSDEVSHLQSLAQKHQELAEATSVKQLEQLDEIEKQEVQTIGHLARLNEQLFQQRMTSEDVYLSHKEDLEAKLAQTQQLRASRGEQLEAQGRQKALQDWKRAQHLDFTMRKKNIAQLLKAEEEAWKKGERSKQEHSRNARLLQKQQADLHHEEEETYQKKTFAGITSRFKGLYRTLGPMLGPLGLGFMGFQIVKPLADAIRSVREIRVGLQQIAATTGASLISIGGQMEVILASQFEALEKRWLTDIKKLLSLGAELRVGGAVPLEQLARAVDYVMAITTKFRELAPEEAVSYMRQLRLQFGLSVETSAKWLIRLGFTAKEAHYSIGGFVKDTLQVATSIRQYGFSLDDAAQLTATFSAELKKGTVTTQDLVNTQLRLQKVQEGQRAYLTEFIMGLTPEQALGMGAADLRELLLEERRRGTGIAGLQEILRAMAYAYSPEELQRVASAFKIDATKFEAAANQLPVVLSTAVQDFVRQVAGENAKAAEKQYFVFEAFKMFGFDVSQQQYAAALKLLEAAYGFGEGALDFEKGAQRTEEAGDKILGAGDTIRAPMDRFAGAVADFDQSLEDFVKAQRDVLDETAKGAERLGITLKQTFRDFIRAMKDEASELLETIGVVRPRPTALEARMARAPSGPYEQAMAIALLAMPTERLRALPTEQIVLLLQKAIEDYVKALPEQEREFERQVAIHRLALVSFGQYQSRFFELLRREGILTASMLKDLVRQLQEEGLPEVEVPEVEILQPAPVLGPQVLPPPAIGPQALVPLAPDVLESVLQAVIDTQPTPADIKGPEGLQLSLTVDVRGTTVFDTTEFLSKDEGEQLRREINEQMLRWKVEQG